MGKRVILLDAEMDVLIVDTGAGIGDTVLYFNIAVQERLLVITPEPTSLTDAYATIKVLSRKHGVDRFRVVVNMAFEAGQERRIFERLAKVCDKFLNHVSLDLAGCLPRDPAVKDAVARQVPFCHASPDSPAARGVLETAKNVASWLSTVKTDGNIKFFWKKLLFNT